MAPGEWGRLRLTHFHGYLLGVGNTRSKKGETRNFKRAKYPRAYAQ